MFGFSKPKTYPRLTQEMIQPSGQTPEPAEAKRLYIGFMEATGFHPKQALSLQARYFSEDLKDHEKSLRDHVADVKQDVKNAKVNLKECKSELKSANSDKERKWTEQAIVRAEANVNEAELQIANALRDLEAFKSDKRPYLIQYVNREMFGDDSSQA